MKQTFYGITVPAGDASFQALRTELFQRGYGQVLLWPPLWLGASEPPLVSPWPASSGDWLVDERGLWLTLTPAEPSADLAPGFLVCPGPFSPADVPPPWPSRRWTKGRWLGVEVIQTGVQPWSEFRLRRLVERPLRYSRLVDGRNQLPVLKDRAGPPDDQTGRSQG